MEIGDFVDVGGCVGTIDAFDDTTVRVSGVWYDYEESQKPFPDPWNFNYSRDLFKEKSVLPKGKFHDGRNEFWDMRGAKHL